MRIERVGKWDLERQLDRTDGEAGFPCELHTVKTLASLLREDIVLYEYNPNTDLYTRTNRVFEVLSKLQHIDGVNYIVGGME